MNELDLTNIYHDVFNKLGLKDYTLKINNRKILLALAESCGGEHLLTDITIAIDKLDKIGLDINFNKHYNHGIEIRFFDHINVNRGEHVFRDLDINEVEDLRLAKQNRNAIKFN
jgi:histidyl-tRNA synthetase